MEMFTKETQFIIIDMVMENIISIAVSFIKDNGLMDKWKVLKY